MNTINELYKQLQLVFYKVPNLKLLRNTERLIRLEYLWTEWKNEPTQQRSEDIVNLFEIIKKEYIGYKDTVNQLSILVNNVLVSEFSVVGIYEYKEDSDGLPLITLDKRYKFNPYLLNVEYQLIDSKPLELGYVYTLKNNGLGLSNNVYFSRSLHDNTYSFSEDILEAY